LHDEELPTRIRCYLERFNVSPEFLQVEITEGSLIDSLEVAVKVLLAIEKIGVGIALDDFGNGYSSFGYIRTLPIHVVKIDRSFIKEINNSPSDAVIVTSIVTLAHNLGKKVVAEGVEMLEQIIHLKTIGCDEVQGYLMSRPIPAEAAEKLLEKPYLVPH
jgi:EAL domain-containing protein (putative c-di-GMP-specific phosphodiesterase class I)